MNKSVSTINSPEFINLQPLDINPLMSKCEIKVLYIGENRNQSYISKEVAMEMAKTLRGAPIVSYFRADKQDFSDHGERVIIDDEGIKFECMTRPYGFVAPDARVWFQTFEDTNDFGETILREYLMTTGYLWTGQYEECKLVVEGDGKPHSMELDEDSLEGHWGRNQEGMDFFIINDAIFSKLCILGEDVEPCFEGSSIKAPDVSASFAKVDDTFKQTLFTMMQDLQSALKGGQQMEDNTLVVEEPIIESVVENIPASETDIPALATEDPFVASEPVVEEGAEFAGPVVESAEPVIEGESAEPIGESVIEGEIILESVPVSAEPTIEEQYTALQEEYSALQATYSSLEAQLAELQTRYSALETAHVELVEFKRQIDDAKKDEMIEKFYMLSDEDKQDVIANKATYTVEDIEEKLSVICFRKKVNFDLNNTSKNDNITEQITFDYSNVGSSEPAWITAVKNTKKNRI